MASHNSPKKNGAKDVKEITDEDRQALMDVFDVNKDGKLSDEELAGIVKSYNSKQVTNEKALEILKRYDTNGDGSMDESEVQHFKHQMDINETNARYAGYSASFARVFRYLAFTSDFGEALRPVVSKTIVNGSYAVAIGYCFADVGWEAYKLKQRNYVTEKGEPMSMTQCIVERSAFQAIASMAVPTLVIHTSVDIAKKVTKKIGRFTKWGPSVVGLSIIPLLPMYLDAPVEHALEWAFENYGPWSHAKKHKD